VSDMTPIDLAGLWVPVITPLAEDGDVDTAALDRLARRLLADGATGLVALGTTGEPATLSQRERDHVVAICAAACADHGKPLMVGVGSSCTRATVEAIHDLDRGVRPGAVLVVVPPYTRPSEAGIVEHFAAVAASSAIPVVVYNVPYRTGRSLSAGTLLALARMPGIVGLKQAVGALDETTLAVLRDRPSTFQVLAGDDAFIVPTILMGGSGAIAASANVCTSTFASMVDAALAARAGDAVALAERLLPVVMEGFREPNPAGWKAALHALGDIATPDLRPPMTAAPPVATAALLDAIASATGGGANEMSSLVGQARR
jgi:4-hydroxy-tetrahydrodipicolinate synthase